MGSQKLLAEILDESLGNRSLTKEDAELLVSGGLARWEGEYLSVTQKGRDTLRSFDPAHYKTLYINTNKKRVSGSRVILVDGLFVWTGGYKTKDLPKRAGFKWDADKKRWSTPDGRKARSLFDFADYDAKIQMGSPTTPSGLENYKDIVLEALKYLASVCDYAQELDYQGFSKSDTHIGHSLAARRELTAEQAALGLPLLRIHKCQLPDWMYIALKPYIDAVAGS